MSPLTTVILSISAAIFVAELKWLVPKVLDWVRLRSRTRDFACEWQSTYEDLDKEPGTLATETITIRVPFLSNNLIFLNHGNTKVFEYRAAAKILNDRYILGEWESVKERAIAKGAFLLVSEDHGNFLFGYWTNKKGYFGKWVMAPLGRDLAEAKILAEKYLCGFPKALESSGKRD